MSKLFAFLLSLSIMLSLIGLHIYAAEAPYKEGDLIVQLQKDVAIETWVGEYNSLNFQVVKLLSRRMNIMILQQKIGQLIKLLF